MKPTAKQLNIIDAIVKELGCEFNYKDATRASASAFIDFHIEEFKESREYSAWNIDHGYF